MWPLLSGGPTIRIAVTANALRSAPVFACGTSSDESLARELLPADVESNRASLALLLTKGPPTAICYRLSCLSDGLSGAHDARMTLASQYAPETGGLVRRTVSRR